MRKRSDFTIFNVPTLRTPKTYLITDNSDSSSIGIFIQIVLSIRGGKNNLFGRKIVN